MLALIFLALLGSIYGYSGWRLIPYLPPPAQIGATLALVFLLLMPLLLFRLRSRPHLAWLTDPLAWVAYLGMGFFIVCSTLLLLRDIGGLPLDLVYPIDAGLHASIDLATFVLTLVVAVYGYYQARRTPAVRRVDVPIADLPPALVGLRIVQISDLHIGPTIKAPFVERVVARVKELQPDLIAFTGDLADGAVERLAPPHDRSSRTHRATRSLFLHRQPRILLGRGELDRTGAPPRLRCPDQRGTPDRLRRRADRLSRRDRLQCWRASPRPRIGPGQGSCRQRRGRCAHPARAPAAQHRGRQPSRLSPATVGPHARRPICTVEVRNPPCNSPTSRVCTNFATLGSTSTEALATGGRRYGSGAPSEIALLTLSRAGSA